MNKIKKLGLSLGEILGIFCILFLIFNLLLYGYCYLTPKISIHKSQSYYLYDNEKKLIFNDSRDWISLEEISPYLIQATLATEDKSFYKHLGFDYFRILKAALKNVQSRSLKEGASTITQQYARNLFLNYDKTWSRKIDEALLAAELEVHYSKEEILEGYLNTINYGGVYGIENASWYYFGHSAKSLSLAEASMLAGIPQSPANYSPIINEKKAKTRQKVVLLSMYHNKKITKEEMDTTYEYSLQYIGKSNQSKLENVLYFRDAVIDELESIDSIPISTLKSGGLKIYTTLDVGAQESLEKAVNKNMDNSSEIQVAGMMVHPNTGAVMALIGGKDYSKSQYNRAMQSKRQVGSTMKPILYYAALENGLTASTTFLSKPTTFTLDNGLSYSPSNYGNIYPNDKITMALAICYSDNIYAIKTHLFLGEDMMIKYARKMGIKSKLEANASLPLGTNELSILEFTNAYATLANSGYSVKGHLIKKVEDGNGDVLYEYKNKKDKVLNKSYTYILSELLSNTYDTSLKSYTSPTCASIKPKLTKKYAVKSGTTDYDLWTVGYNPDVVVGVWTGYDDNRKLSNKEYKYAKNIWADTMEGYLREKDAKWYEKPGNVIGVLTDVNTGKEATNDSKLKTILYYIKGTEPGYKSKNKSVIKEEKKTTRN